MKTILVPTDFSKNANNALTFASEVAKKMGAKIILLHVYQVTYFGPDIPYQFVAEQIAAIREKAIEQLKFLQTKLSKAGKLNCEVVCEQGAINEVILETSQKVKPELIIMGTKGASGIKKVIMGSNTAKIIEKATCPVIAVPEKVKYNGLKKITYATNYNSTDLDSLKFLVKTVKPFNSRITLFHVCDDEFTPDVEKEHLIKFKAKVKSKIKYEKISFKVEAAGDVTKALEVYSKREKPDLIVMSTHHRSLLDKLFGTSLTKKMVYHSKIPLLAFHFRKNSVILI